MTQQRASIDGALSFGEMIAAPDPNFALSLQVERMARRLNFVVAEEQERAIEEFLISGAMPRDLSTVVGPTMVHRWRQYEVPDVLRLCVDRLWRIR